MRNPKPKTSASLLIVPMIALVATLTASAQEAVPMLVHYQGELRSPTTGDPVPDGNYDMTFEIWDGPGIRAQSVWRTLHTAANGNPVEIKGGLFNVVLGSRKALKASVFDESERWLEISVEGGTLSPRQGITSAAYSIVSENSRLLDGKEASEYVIQAQGLRLQPTATTPNIIAGHEDNAVTDGVVAATISGGGRSGAGHLVTDAYGTIGGGAENQAGDNAGTTGSAYYATVGGGLNNTASASYATVGGGWDNEALNHAATVGGGNSNTASGAYAIVGGGYNNTASGNYATIAGGGPSDPADAVNTNNRVFDHYGTIGGGGYNRAGSDDADPATDKYATVAGGKENTAGGERATVGGGVRNVASGSETTVGGGSHNEASVTGATVGGGRSNKATQGYATVGGGELNMATGPYVTVGGGRQNEASGDHATVGGGHNNIGSGEYATLGGGEDNEASDMHATVGGGELNIASGPYATVPGGRGAAARCYGQHAYASGMFPLAERGGAQTSLYVLRNVATGTDPTELFLDGVGERMTIPVGGTWAFEAMVVGRTNDGGVGPYELVLSCGFVIRGMVRNARGTTVVWASTVDPIAVLNVNNSATAEADDTHDALVIKVTGAGDYPMRWVAAVRTAEVMWPE